MSLLLLAGCGAPLAIGGAIGGVGMYATSPSELPPADTADQIPPHESWCYKTMGEEVECYAEPQDTPPGRLLNVDPPNRYPLTARAYADVVAQNRLANAPKEAVKDIPDPGTAAMPPVQSGVIAPVQPQVVAPAPQPPAAHKTKKHKKKHKKAAKPTPPATPATPPISN